MNIKKAYICPLLTNSTLTGEDDGTRNIKTKTTYRQEERCAWWRWCYRTRQCAITQNAEKMR